MTVAVVAFIVACVFVWKEEAPSTPQKAESEFTFGNVTNLEWQAILAEKEAQRQAKLKATAELLEALGSIAEALGDAD